MKNILLSLALLLAGCGGGQPPTDVPTSFDYVGPTGTRVAYEPGVVRNDPVVYENGFIEMRQCAFDKGFSSLNMKGPPVKVVNERPFVNGIYDDGVTYSNGLIVITRDGDDLINHEMMHYILLIAGGDWRNHEHQAFQECVFTGGIVPIVTAPITSQ